MFLRRATRDVVEVGLASNDSDTEEVLRFERCPSTESSPVPLPADHTVELPPLSPKPTLALIMASANSVEETLVHASSSALLPRVDRGVAPTAGVVFDSSAFHSARDVLVGIKLRQQQVGDVAAENVWRTENVSVIHGWKKWHSRTSRNNCTLTIATLDRSTAWCEGDDLACGHQRVLLTALYILCELSNRSAST